jgi:hypothetical protein
MVTHTRDNINWLIQTVSLLEHEDSTMLIQEPASGHDPEPTLTT